MKRSHVVLNLTWLIVAAAFYLIGRGPRSEGPAGFPGDLAALPASRAPSGDREDADSQKSADTGSARAASVRGLTGNALTDTLLTAGTPPSAEEMRRGIEEALDEANPLQSNLMFVQLLQMLTPENAAAAMAAFSNRPPEWSTGNRMTLFGFAWGGIDGRAAAEHAAALSGRAKEFALPAVMSGWAGEYPRAAIQWVASLEDQGERSRFTRALVAGLAKADPDLATEYALAQHAEGNIRFGEHVSGIAREQFKRGIDAASTWAESLPADELKETALRRVAGEYAARDAETAAVWVERFVGTAYGAGAVGEVAEEWAEDDPAAAASWVHTLPAGESRARAFKEVIREWTERDAYAASVFLSGMPGGPDRDAAITSLSRRHVTADPEAAIAWAGTIGDNGLRIDTLAQTARAWMRRDPESALAWLSASGLPDDVRIMIADSPESGDRWARLRRR